MNTLQFQSLLVYEASTLLALLFVCRLQEYSYLSVHWEEKKPIKFIGPQGWRPSRALLLAWSHMGSFCIALGDTLIYSLVWVIPLLVAYLVVLCFRKK